MMINFFWIAVGLLFAMPAVLSRCWFLAPTTLGFLFYYPNVIKDYFTRRLSLPRALGDVPPFAAGIVASLFAGPAGAGVVLFVVAVVVALEVALQVRERLILVTSWATEDPRWQSPSGGLDTQLEPGVGPHPSPHPELTLTLTGPFVQRRPEYDLGAMASGREAVIEVVVGNHTRVPSQVAPQIEVQSPNQITARIVAGPETAPLRSGETARWQVAIRQEDGAGGAIGIAASCGPWQVNTRIIARPAPTEISLSSATISRYPGSRRAAFAWRGDMDHYDTASFQSIEGLEKTLGLAARYRVPQTMYLSTRLTLEPEATRDFYDHFGVVRGADEVETFIAWMNKRVDLQHSAPYPCESTKPYVMELGNHMHLHYGTDASAAPENGWKRGAGIGSGRYPWMTGGDSSFEEQRDNALEARRWIEKAFGFSPRSWAMPDSTKDHETARAVHAAGCDVTSDADGRHTDNVVFQPPPHFARGSGAVELTKRYPGDPESLVAAEMNRFWMHRAWRLAIPVIFMCHQHMRQFAGDACSRFTEFVIRCALADFNGDLYIDTVYGIGAYWKAALAPEGRSVTIRIDGGTVRVENTGNWDLVSVPIDLTYQRGERAVVLIDLPAHSGVTIQSSGKVEGHDGL